MLWVSPVLFDCHIRMTNRNIRDKLEQDRPISANQEGTVRAMGRNVESMEYLFETERLRIRKFESTDAQCLYENHSEEEVKKWFPNESYADVEEAQDAIRFYADCVDRGHLPYVLAVERKEKCNQNGELGVSR